MAAFVRRGIYLTEQDLDAEELLFESIHDILQGLSHDASGIVDPELLLAVNDYPQTREMIRYIVLRRVIVSIFGPELALELLPPPRKLMRQRRGGANRSVDDDDDFDVNQTKLHIDENFPQAKSKSMLTNITDIINTIAIKFLNYSKKRN